MPKTKSSMPLHTTESRPSLQGCAPFSMRRALCVAGLAAAVALSAAPLAFADGLDIPDGSWDPSIEVDIDGNPIQTPALPEPEPDPTPEPDPMPEPEPEPQPGVDNPGWDMPDSGTNLPDYGDIYGDTSADSVGAGAGAFYDPAADAPAEQESDTSQNAAAIPVPVFGGYDAASGALSGSATPGYAVQLIDAQGAVINQAWVDEAGAFWLQLPEGYDLSSVSLVVVDGDGVWMSGVLTGEAMADSVARQERDAVLGQVGAATSSLAKGFVGSLNVTPVGASVEAPAEENLPILPYAIGAGSALVAVAAVGGAVYAFRKIVGSQDDADNAGDFDGAPRSEVVRTDGSPSVNPVVFSPAHALSAHAVPVSERCDSFDDGLDDLERLALGMSGTRDGARSLDAPQSISTVAMAFGGARPDDTLGWVIHADASAAGVTPSEDDTFPVDGALHVDGEQSTSVGFQTGDSPDTTIPCSSVMAPIDPETFAAIARVLATGAGRVHRVTTSTRDLDMAGLDLFDESKTPVSPQPAADPMVDGEDWCGIALRELIEPAHGSAEADCPMLSTEDYVALTKTKADVHAVESDSNLDAIAYVAPVVGPSSVTPQEVERHKTLLDQAQTAQAVAIRERDAAFLGHKRKAAVQKRSDVPVIEASAISDVAETRGCDSAALTASVPAAGTTCLVSKDGVPIIARGSGSQIPGPARRSPTVGDVSAQRSQVVTRRACLCDVPDFERQDITCSVAPSNLVSTGHSLDYDAFSPGASVAAAYAAAVYGRVACGDPIRADGETAPAAPSGALADAGAPETHAQRRQLTAQFVPVVDERVDQPYADEYDYRTETMLSPAYINYMVQDEFEHRHDTPAQRNAALGRMRIVNGAACPPVSVREHVARHRNMA